jgi:hypothetical protein
MKVLFIRADGRCVAEKIGPFKRHIGMQDGLHPVTPRCIHKDCEGRLPAIMIIWQGIPAPEGQAFDTVAGEALMQEAEIIKQHRQKVSISRRWVRRTINGFILLCKFILLAFMLTILSFIVWAIGTVFL